MKIKDKTHFSKEMLKPSWYLNAVFIMQDIQLPSSAKKPLK